MEIHNLLDAKSRLELREWLQENHDKEMECWVVVGDGMLGGGQAGTSC